MDADSRPPHVAPSPARILAPNLLTSQSNSSMPASLFSNL